MLFRRPVPIDTLPDGDLNSSAELAEQVDTQFPGANERVRFWEVLRQIMSFLIGGLIAGTGAAVKASGVETIDDIRSFDHRLVVLAEPAKAANAQLHEFLVNHLYSHASLVRDRELAVQKLGELFQFLLAHPECISAGYRERLKEDPIERVVCDYIAGMTDTYFHKIHHELLPEALVTEPLPAQ